MLTKTRARIVALTLSAAALTLAGAGAAQAAPAIPLTGGQESPKPTAFGAHGSFTYEIDGTQFCYTLEVSGLSAPATAAHVHVGERNAPGGVVIPLVVPMSTDFDVSACTTASTGLLAAIEADPSAYYVNVHNADNPGGEIRGQLK
ncbi:CHRD domain-containing protein [Agromyces humi]|uniref:CHRD domain-containing protein n=1 Tax=Agromyces humi TaxID=1766800 RepID=UPI00135A2F41|nr:CHRD domain-containing protein [Agromyces humi]